MIDGLESLHKKIFLILDNIMFWLTLIHGTLIGMYTKGKKSSVSSNSSFVPYNPT